jgi:hypothetical protein
MNKAIKVINEIPATKAGVKLFAASIVEGVLSGNVNPLSVRAKIDAIEKVIKTVKDDAQFRDVVLGEADNYGEKTFEFDGFKFTIADAARYDYSRDEVWQTLKEAENNAANDRKEREKILQAIKEPTLIDDVISYPAVKISSTTVRVTLT